VLLTRQLLSKKVKSCSLELVCLAEGQALAETSRDNLPEVWTNLDWAQINGVKMTTNKRYHLLARHFICAPYRPSGSLAPTSLPMEQQTREKCPASLKVSAPTPFRPLFAPFAAD